MKPERFWISGPWPGRLAIVTRPRGGDWLEDEARAWRRDGIDVVVSLLEGDEAGELDLLDQRAATEKSGMRFISFPIPDRGVPASKRDAVALLASIVGLLESGKNVAVHCRQGVGRSGLIASGVLMASGASHGQAIEAVSAARGATIPETSEQLLWTQQLPVGLPVARR